MTSLANRKILIIGGAGFIGHHLALNLKKMGVDVHILDSLEVNNLKVFEAHKDNIPNADLYLKILRLRLQLLKEADIPLVTQDARDYVRLGYFLEDLQADTIIQLAAVAHAGKSNKNPHSTFDHSLRTLENALDIARCESVGIKHFIYFSSSMVYGHFPSGVVTEETPCNPLGIYGALKYAGEKIVVAYNQVFNLPYTIIRPSALYGERCVSRRVGQVFVENAIQGLTVSINGDGSDQLDFTYIDDLVSGVLCILTHEEAKNQIFNLTYGEARSIGDVSKILKEHFPDVEIHNLPKDKLMPNRGTLSVEKAKKMVGYNPQHTLEEGFTKYINWYKDIFSSF